MSRSGGPALVDRLSSLSDDELAHLGWAKRAVASGEQLCAEGEAADALYVVREGELEVRVGDRAVASLGAGDSVGEASVFFSGEKRRASIVATSDAKLLKLSRFRVRQLREESAAVYDWLIDGALHTLWEQLERQDRELVSHCAGDADAPVSRAPSTLRRLWKQLRRTDREPPSALDALAKVPGLAHADRHLLLPLASVLEPKLVEAEHALFYEGDEGVELYLVAEGQIEILRLARDETARRLTLAEVGCIIGVGGFLGGGPRSASAVATRDCWVFGLAPSVLATLPFFVRRLLQDALLAVMRAQLVEANLLMTELRGRDV